MRDFENFGSGALRSASRRSQTRMVAAMDDGRMVREGRGAPSCGDLTGGREDGNQPRSTDRQEAFQASMRARLAGVRDALWRQPA